MSKTITTLILCVLTCVITSSAFAAPKAFQASVAPGIALHDRNQKIEGLTLSLWGENPQTSFALGIVNGTAGNSGGLSLGFINYGDKYKGVQLGFLNADKDLHGAQLGFLNIAKGKKTGFQFGLINVITTNKKWFSNFPNEIAPFMIFINWRLEK
ncbi:MAG: hypothetical protein KOO69_08875 [Victivallales bacterium]|nr:hypothetical protein [Victivallales bacterium]